jgi:N4-(beta-N-acetylglucosaminyl)-L-asparaginase
MIALDANGDLCLHHKRHGVLKHGRWRFAIIGAGLYVDNEKCATATAWGRSNRITGCHLVVELMRQGKSHKSGSEEVMRIVNLTKKRNKI